MWCSICDGHLGPVYLDGDKLYGFCTMCWQNTEALEAKRSGFYSYWEQKLINTSGKDD